MQMSTFCNLHCVVVVVCGSVLCVVCVSCAYLWCSVAWCGMVCMQHCVAEVCMCGNGQFCIYVQHVVVLGVILLLDLHCVCVCVFVLVVWCVCIQNGAYLLCNNSMQRPTTLARVELFCYVDFVRWIDGTGDWCAKRLKRGLLRWSGTCPNLFSMSSASNDPVFTRVPPMSSSMTFSYASHQNCCPRGQPARRQCPCCPCYVSGKDLPGTACAVLGVTVFSVATSLRSIQWCRGNV